MWLQQLPRLERLHQSKIKTFNSSSVCDGIEDDYSAQIILEMLEAAITQGASLPHALAIIGQSLQGEIGEILEDVGERLSNGEEWDRVWKTYRGNERVLSVIHNVLEPAWKRGASPALRIESAIAQINAAEETSITTAAHELSVRILLPLGLCFLPGFIVIAVLPLMSSWQAIIGS